MNSVQAVNVVNSTTTHVKTAVEPSFEALMCLDYGDINFSGESYLLVKKQYFPAFFTRFFLGRKTGFLRGRGLG